jgi:hypothetical protein
MIHINSDLLTKYGRILPEQKICCQAFAHFVPHSIGCLDNLTCTFAIIDVLILTGNASHKHRLEGCELHLYYSTVSRFVNVLT